MYTMSKFFLMQRLMMRDIRLDSLGSHRIIPQAQAPNMSKKKPPIFSVAFMMLVGLVLKGGAECFGFAFSVFGADLDVLGVADVAVAVVRTSCDGASDAGLWFLWMLHCCLLKCIRS